VWNPALFAVSPVTQKVFFLSFGVWFLIEMWIVGRDRRAASGEQKDRGSKLFIYAMVWIAIATAFAAPYSFPKAHINLPGGPVFWTAIILIWAGIALRSWAVITLGRFFRSTVQIQDDHSLVTSGPYRVLRHPSYTGGLLTIAGIGLAMGNWISLAVTFFLVLLAYTRRIVVEEAALRMRFGDMFEANRKKTWAIIPPLW
jgi:protein-S-isoprenylcysteine O-methyltransferase